MSFELQNVSQTLESAGSKSDDSDIDALISEYSQPEQSAAQEAPQPQTPEQTQSPTQATSEIEFTWNGKQIKAPLDKAKQWAQQGYDYAQRMSEFNQQRQEFEKHQAWAKEAESKYKPIDEYVRQNPEFWDHVTQSWQQKQGVAPLETQDPVVKSLAEKLSKQEAFLNELKEKELTQRRQQEDQVLDQEMKSIREKYSYLDFNSVGPDGTSIEQQVLKYATENGIRKYETAFKDLFHDQILKKAQEEAREAVSKDIQKRKEAGLLGSSPTPRKVPDVVNTKNMTYDQILERELASLGLT